MPFIAISVTGPALPEAAKTALFQETTALMRDVMKKNAALTAVRIDAHPGGHWAIGGNPVPVAAHMDIKITAGTNSDAEKAEMIRRSMEMLRRHVGALPEASYVVIHDLDGAAWGYDGQTQTARAAARGK